MKTTLLIDADILAYKHSFGNETVIDFGDTGKGVSVGSFKRACERADKDLAKWVDMFKASNVIICLSCPTNEGFRLNQVLPTYKGNRQQEKPQQLGRLKEYLKRAYDSYERPTLEGDDILGILATSPDIIQGHKIIISEDKDMQTLPCNWYNPRKHKGRAKKISVQEADRFHMLQTLMGDTTDHYKGIPGRGIKFAQKLLDDTPHEDLWEAVVCAYEANGLTEEDALVQARCARILRHTDYDFKNKEVVLWTPNQ